VEDKRTIVRKHCEFWLKTFKKLTFLIKSLNALQQYITLKSEDQKQQIITLYLKPISQISEYLQLLIKLDEFIQNCNTSSNHLAIADAKLIASSIPKGIYILDPKHHLLLTTVLVSALFRQKIKILIFTIRSN
jgi:hypothetical protein